MRLPAAALGRLATAWMVAAITSCSVPPSIETPATTANSPPASLATPEASVEPPASHIPGISPVPEVSASWDWQEVGTLDRRREFSASPTFDGRYLIDVTRSRRGSVVVVDTRGGSVVINHEVPDFNAGWATDRAWLMDPWLLLTETNHLRPAPTRVYRYDLRTAQRVELSAIAGFPSAYLVWSAADGLAVFNSDHPRRLLSCLVVMDVSALTWEQRWCGPEGWLVGWAQIGADGTVTFRLQEDPRPDTEPCVRLLRMALDGVGQPDEIMLNEECHAFSGAGGFNWTAWSEVGLRDEDIEDSHGYAELEDGTLVDLGYVETGTISACGEWVYWNDYVAWASAERLIRWRPGEPKEVVFTTPRDSLLSGGVCSGSWFTIMVSEQGATEHVYTVKPPS
jgi:hypothetical protein